MPGSRRPDPAALELAELAARVAYMRPAYARAYLDALEQKGMIPPSSGYIHLHPAEVLVGTATIDAEESRRGRKHAEAGRRPTFVDTDVTAPLPVRKEAA